MLLDGGRDFRVAAHERSETGAGLISRANSRERHGVGADRVIFATHFLVYLREMVADFTVAAEGPGGIHVLFGFVIVAAGELNPAEGVPVGVERGDHGEIVHRDLVKG